MPLTFAKPLLMCTTACAERVFTDSRSLHHPANNLQFDRMNHWIAKGSQQRCSLPGCKGTSRYCKKSNVGLHAECFELHHCK